MKREFTLETEVGFNPWDFIKEFRYLKTKGFFKSVTTITQLTFDKEEENGKEEFILREKYGVR